MTIHLPDGAVKLIYLLESNGHPSYLVGGCVRDSIRGAAPADYDIATAATPDQMLSLLSDYKLILTGYQFGTVTAIAQGESYELTTFRVDSKYSDHRRPDSVCYTRSVYEDLARRDFTINAMAYHPSYGLIDPFGGERDLKSEIVRCVGKPEKRFGEDALRIFRAARFASVLDFTLDKPTHTAMEAGAGALRCVSAERVFAELCRALPGSGFGRVSVGCPRVLSGALPELAGTVGFLQNTPYHAYDVYGHTLYAVDASPQDLTVRLAMLLHDIGKPYCHTTDSMGVDHFKGHAYKGSELADDALRRLGCASRIRQDVCELILHHRDVFSPDRQSVRRWLSKLGEEQTRRLIEVKAADSAAKAAHIKKERIRYRETMAALLESVLREQLPFRLNQLAISGKDILSLGVKPGPQIGKLLDNLLSRVIADEIPNEHSALVAAAESEIFKSRFSADNPR